MKIILLKSTLWTLLLFAGIGFAEEASQETAGPRFIKSDSCIGQVIFPHDKHVDELGIECKTCHHETNAATLKFPHEDYFDDFWIDCTICHRENKSAVLEPQVCSVCHHTRPEGIADETLSAKVVIHKNCWTCHPVGRGQDSSQKCQFCHTGIRSSCWQGDLP